MSARVLRTHLEVAGDLNEALVYAVDGEQIRIVGLFHTRKDPSLIRQTLDARTNSPDV